MLTRSAIIALAAGCGASGPPSVHKVDVDGIDTATAAMEQYDANQDGAITTGELVTCPPLAMAFTRFDADRDERLTSDEIGAGISKIYGTGAALATFDGAVLLSDRPLPGAQVRFRPIAFLEGAVQSAEGKTDEAGAVRPTISDANLPENLRGQPFIHPGLYHVEITHPDHLLPARYNSATELGAIVDPSSRGGLVSQFDLKP